MGARDIGAEPIDGCRCGGKHHAGGQTDPLGRAGRECELRPSDLKRVYRAKVWLLTKAFQDVVLKAQQF